MKKRTHPITRKPAALYIGELERPAPANAGLLDGLVTTLAIGEETDKGK